MVRTIRKKVFNPINYNTWIRNSALTPTPILLNASVIRVYCGFRDDLGVSRIGFVDVSSEDPTEVIQVSSSPVLDIGRPGCFDDNGVILGHILSRGNEIWMYYIGFQIVTKAKFLAFTGLAISKDNGYTFSRFSEVPILDRVSGGSTIRALHSLTKDGSGWKAWFAQGDNWEIINGKVYPRYNIWETDSLDGINFEKGKLVLDNDVLLNEYRIGRPSVFEVENKRFMFFTKGSTSGKDYFPGMAWQDSDGNWQRNDSLFPLQLSRGGWDSLHLCYPRFIKVNEKAYLFYNGNNMGHEGFGVVEVTDWVTSQLRNIQKI